MFDISRKAKLEKEREDQMEKAAKKHPEFWISQLVPEKTIDLYAMGLRDNTVPKYATNAVNAVYTYYLTKLDVTTGFIDTLTDIELDSSIVDEYKEMIDQVRPILDEFRRQVEGVDLHENLYELVTEKKLDLLSEYAHAVEPYLEEDSEEDFLFEIDNRIADDEESISREQYLEMVSKLEDLILLRSPENLQFDFRQNELDLSDPYVRDSLDPLKNAYRYFRIGVRETTK